MGGPSTEHEISLISGSNIVRAMDEKKYNVHPVLISKDNVWKWSSRELTPYQQNSFSINYFHSLGGNSLNELKTPALSDLPDADIAFIALHGAFGEDGKIQALLENWNIAYTGSGVLASALAMDKIQAKYTYLANEIPTADFEVLYRKEFSGEKLISVSEKLGFPLVVKDPCGGSSLDMGIAEDLDQFMDLVENLLSKFPRVICEKYISGTEASCGFLENGPILPPTEIKPHQGEYFDFEAKYQGKSEEITPANLSPELTQKIQQIAERAHKVLNCSVYSRTDVRIDANGDIFVLETNTLHGMTPQSLLPQQAAHQNIGYAELIDRIIAESLQKV
ncbi:MAG: D-alanine--D-alanine ligase [Fibrobacter sp.]|nr:D-alanine--D-alanine ligase [Fibrobacter sp.]